MFNDKSISEIKISKDLVMTLKELRREIDTKQIDILKGKNYAFAIDEESVLPNDLESELLIKDIELYVTTLSIPIIIFK